MPRRDSNPNVALPEGGAALHAAGTADAPKVASEAAFREAPVPLWLEDWSGVRALLEDWREAGVADIRAFLDADPLRVEASSRAIRILAVNDRALALLAARDLDHLVDNLSAVFRGDMLRSHVDELVQLFDGGCEFCSLAANYALDGRRLDVQVKGRALPGHERDLRLMLISTEDVTARETARRRALESDAYAQGLFEHSPVSLWVEDFSAVKDLIAEVRAGGVTDFRTFTDVHPEFVRRCMSEIRVLDVNRHTLELFRARDKRTLLHRLDDVFRGSMEGFFREQLIDLWNDRLFHVREVVNYALDGEELHVHMQFSVLPGHEAHWDLVQVALTDITARRKAEAYLEFLGRHDPLTKLYNRSFYVEELNRLERKGPLPVTVIVADLNGLKAANDQLGHAAGDALLRRAGEVIKELVDKPCTAARIGGDEFAILMPGVDQQDGEAMMENIRQLVDINNQFYTAVTLSLSMGVATSRPGERLEAVVKRADLLMFESKRAHYADETADDRATGTDAA